MQHFRSYLDSEGHEATMAEEEKIGETMPVYVKKWTRTRHAIMFRMSNKVVQVLFQDKTEVILSADLKSVTYVNKVGERTTLKLSDALESSNEEMTKRLKYTKEILVQISSNSGGKRKKKSIVK